MSTPEPELRWYQFSLRSLLLVTLFMAVLCSLGVWANWSVAVVIAVGGIAGGIVARSLLGFARGIVTGGLFSIVSGIAGLLWRTSFRSIDEIIATMQIAAIVGSLIGGILGGYTARYRSKR
ncbi:MAG: hypothetical protein ABSG53_26315 [Thermoguttaceae bacterium]|jgi:hypothetical protein